ncbi:MAG: hypothetical protein IT260_02225 [Saprospiraceae bacterium]|nr:hypothetical protein [Saprospiraceae bacterium]
MKNWKIFTLGFLGCLACNKMPDLYEESVKYCKDNFVITCTEPIGMLYFTGLINGSRLCVSEGIDDYWMQNGIAIESVTSTQYPVLSPDTPEQSTFYTLGFYPPIFDNLNGILTEFAPYISIDSPHVSDTTHYTQHYYIEKFFKKGDLALRNKFADQYSSYNFSISWTCVMQPGYRYYYNKNPAMIPSVIGQISPSFGIQHNSSFRISDFSKSISGNWINYDITLQITCDLYYKDRSYYGRLENGIFKTRITLPADE